MNGLDLIEKTFEVRCRNRSEVVSLTKRSLFARAWMSEPLLFDMFRKMILESHTFDLLANMLATDDGHVCAFQNMSVPVSTVSPRNVTAVPVR